MKMYHEARSRFMALSLLCIFAILATFGPYPVHAGTENSGGNNGNGNAFAGNGNAGNGNPGGGKDKGGSSETLSAEQAATMKAILSKYSAASLTAADAKAIHEAFRSAGIHPCKGFKEAITEAGFDPEALRNLDPPPARNGNSGGNGNGGNNGNNNNGNQGGVKNKGGSSETLSAEQAATMKSILSKYSAASLTAADAKAIHEAFRSAGIRPCKGFKEVIIEAGFDPEVLRTLAPPPDRNGNAGGNNGNAFGGSGNAGNGNNSVNSSQNK